ncbi:MAG: hypothetical protein ABI193_06665, partial [Minicystis sp.]
VLTKLPELPSAGQEVLRIVIVATAQGTVPLRVFFCTDATVDVATLVETHAGRWDTALVLWLLEDAPASPFAVPPLRPWSSPKRGRCFADILRAARRSLASFDILDPTNDIKHLQKLARSSPSA